MNIHKYTFFISIVLLFSTTKQLPAQSQQKIIVDSHYNKLLNQELDNISTLEYQLSTIVFNLFSAPQKQSCDQQEIKDAIKQTQSLITQIKQANFFLPQLETTYQLQQIVKLLATNIQQAVNSNFARWEALNFDQLITRSKLTATPEQVLSQAQENHGMIITLGRSIETIGLTQTQRVVRATEEFCTKYKVGKKLLYGLGGLTVCAYLAYQFGPHSDHIPTESSLFPHSKIATTCYKATKKVKEVIGNKVSYAKKPLQATKNLLPSRTVTRYPLPATHPICDLKKQLPPLQEELLAEKHLGIFGTADSYLNYINLNLAPSTLIGGAGLAYFSDDSPERLNGMFIPYLTALIASSQGNRGKALLPISNLALGLKLGTCGLHKGRTTQAWEATANWFERQYQKLRGNKLVTKVKTGELIKPKTNFDSIIGNRDKLVELEPIVDFAVNPEKAKRAKLDIQNMILVGPPRTGKSYLAQALAGEINKRKKLLGQKEKSNFIILDADLILEKNFVYTIKSLERSGDCVIIFIDEIDLLALNRKDPSKANRLLSLFLSYMGGNSETADGKKRGRLIFIAATNNIDSLDPALVQPGRFGKIIYFQPPNLQERITFLKQTFEEYCMPIAPEFMLTMAQELEGFTFDDIKQIVITARQKAYAQYRSPNETYLQLAIDEHTKKIVTRHTPLSKEELAYIASYQAGKAIASQYLLKDQTVCTVTTLPNKPSIHFTDRASQDLLKAAQLEHGNVFTYPTQDIVGGACSTMIKSNTTRKHECATLFAGHLAQQLLLGEAAYTYRAADTQQAMQIAKEIALQGACYDQLSKEQQQQVLKQATSLVTECKRTAQTILEQKQKELTRVYQALLKKELLNQQEFRQLLAGQSTQDAEHNDQPEMGSIATPKAA